MKAFNNHYLTFIATNYMVMLKVTFRAGSSSRISGGIIYQANSIVFHPNFNIESFEFDVALVRVTRQFQGPNIAIIKLVDESVSIRDRSKATFAGWGVTNVKYIGIT